MNFEESRLYIIDRLQSELRPNLYYHCLDHTLDVLESAIRLAKLEMVGEHGMMLIKTAALFHDSGMLYAYNGHEEASVRLANAVLPGYGFSGDDIAAIKGMIMATKLPQSPDNKLEQILCDADLDYLGREDFFMISHRLKLEWHERGQVQTLRDWYHGQIDFLSNHTYFTDSAKKLRRKKKIDNLNEIKALFS